MRKITYTTSGLLMIINYYYQHIMGKRKMKQTEGEFGLMVELRAPSLFKLFHKEGNLGLGTQETCTSSRSFLRGSGTESQSSDSTYRSQAMQLDSAPKMRLPRGWGWVGGVSLPWELVADSLQTGHNPALEECDSPHPHSIALPKGS